MPPMHSVLDRAMPALALAATALVFAPLLPGLYWALKPGLAPAAWSALLANNEWPQALRATLVSALLSTALALLLTGALAMRLYPGAAWTRLQRRLAWWLSVPHAAFAVGIVFLVAPSGWLARLVALAVGWSAPPAWVTVQDAWGLCLALALAIKECGFLLWALAAALGEQDVIRQMTVARSLGYARRQAWRHVVWPQVLPRLGWPLAAVFAYGLSVVDMAVILGPTNPPTLAVLVWRWLTDAGDEQQAMGCAAVIAMCGALALALAGTGWLAHRLRRTRAYPPGGRTLPPQGAVRQAAAGAPLLHGLLTVVALVVVSLLAWSVAGPWFFPAAWPDGLTLASWRSADLAPFATSLWLGVAACLAALPMTLAWLEWGPARLAILLYLPLVVPVLPLAAGQYGALLRADLDGTPAGLVWSHLLWVLPYMVLTLSGPYRAFDARYLATARALGRSRLRACLSVKWPMLLRPILAALAVGFSVSVAQYLPTLFAGNGRYATVTTEAVALSAGGNRRVLAVQALLQVALPLAAFALAGAVGYMAGRNRRGLR